MKVCQGIYTRKSRKKSNCPCKVKPFPEKANDPIFHDTARSSVLMRGRQREEGEEGVLEEVEDV